ncbi:MAG: thioredoxin domain-containing protein [Bacteroidales bacterium]|nr:thioredoxin domain-containing protein [Bacteroidales bacterium]
MIRKIFMVTVLIASTVLLSCSSKKNGNLTEDNVVVKPDEVAQADTNISVDNEEVELFDSSSGDSKEEVKVASEKIIDHTVKLDDKKFAEMVFNIDKNHPNWIYEGDKPALIDFYADWCGPCRRAAPILENLAKEYAGKIYIYKVDTEVEKQLAGYFRVQSLPTFMFIPVDGQPSFFSGIGRTDAETKAIFEREIKNRLLN